MVLVNLLIHRVDDGFGKSTDGVDDGFGKSTNGVDDGFGRHAWGVGSFEEYAGGFGSGESSDGVGCSG